MIKKIFYIGTVFFFLSILQINAETYNQNETSKTVKLVVSGEGETKEEAVKVALRSAIEQAFGTFVSSNTDVLNDDIVKDEIATVSSGNIQGYKELSTTNLGSIKVVNIEAVVSIDKLVSFTASKGMKTELAGATFAMNMKMKELNKKNEMTAITNLYKQLSILGGESHLFDYELITSEPYQVNSNLYGIDVTIKTTPNKNAVTFYNIYKKTLSSLAIKPNEINEFKKSKIDIHSYDVGFNVYNYSGNKYFDNQFVYLRNNLAPSQWNGAGKRSIRKVFDIAFLSSLFRFKIVDNLGNEFVIGKKEFPRPKATSNDWNTQMSVAIVGRYDIMDITSVEKNIIYFIARNKETGKFFAPKVRRTLGEYVFTGPNDIDDIADIITWDKSFTICLTYLPEEFMKLSSFEIMPISDLHIIEKDENGHVPTLDRFY